QDTTTAEAGHADDASSDFASHVGHDSLCPNEHAARVDIHCPIPMAAFQCQQQLHNTAGRLGYQNIDATEGLSCLLDQVLDFFLFGYVGLDLNGLHTQLCNGMGCFLGGLSLAHIVNRHIGAATRQGQGDTASNAPAAAGYNGGF